MPLGPNLLRMASSFMNSTGAPSASPTAPPSRQPLYRLRTRGSAGMRGRSGLSKFSVKLNWEETIVPESVMLMDYN